jgi:hypothetical protein
MCKLTLPPEGSSAISGESQRISRIDSDRPRLPPGRAIRNINEALNVESTLSGFLPAAENTLLAASDDFTGSLGVKAIQIARMRNATAVDRQDVLVADKSLRSNVGAEKRGWLLGLASFAGGAAIAALVAFLLAPRPISHPGDWWISIIALAIFSTILFSVSYPSRRRSDSS